MSKKIAKKLGAAAAAAAAAAGSSLTAFAALSDATIDTDATGSITIHKYDITSAEEDGLSIGDAATGEENAAVEEQFADYALAGVTFTYLKVGDAHTYTDGEEVYLYYCIPTALADIIGITGSDFGLENLAETGTYAVLSDTINEVMADLDADAKDNLKEYIEDNDGTDMDATDANGVTSVDGLDLGLYLIVETSVPANVTYTVEPFFVQLPFTSADGDEWLYDLDVYPKNQTGDPTIDKLVRSDEEDAAYEDTATASIGDTVDYNVLVGIPDAEGEATHLTHFEITDVISDGLTYNEDAVVAIYDSEEASRNGDNPSAVFGEDEIPAATISYDEESDTITVSFTGDALEYLNENCAGKYISILYTCDVNDDAVLGDNGNENDATLTWGRTGTASTDYESIDDEAQVYSYGLNLTKSFSGTGGDFSDVSFVLQNDTDGFYLVAEESGDTAGHYYITGTTTDEEEATAFTPDENGALVIYGLEADTYLLTETSTSSGYNLLKDAIEITITATDKEITAATVDSSMDISFLDEASATVDGSAASMSKDGVADSANAFVDLSVVNTKGFILPQTGGTGIYAVTIIGIAAVAAGAYAYRKSQKKVAE